MDGIPSPNPEFPQQIKNVTGNANVKIQNKNLFDSSNLINWYVNYSEPVGYSSNIYCGINQFFKLKPNTSYTISTKQNVKRLFMPLYDKDYNILRQTVIIDGKQVTFTTNSIEQYAKMCFSLDGTTTMEPNNYKEFIQLELGSTATSYVPHEEQNLPFTFSEGQILGNEEELKDNGKDDIWGEYIFTGNENWVDYQGTQTGDFYKFYTTGVKLGRTNNMEAKENAYCTHFINNRFYVNDNGIGLTQNATYISIDKTLASTPEELKTWFATQYANGKPVKVQYKKKNPTVTAYTETQQAQYNAIKNAKSYDEQTNISQTYDELPFILDIEALKGETTNEVNLLTRNNRKTAEYLESSLEPEEVEKLEEERVDTEENTESTAENAENSAESEEE